MALGALATQAQAYAKNLGISTSFTIPADIVREVGGDRVVVTSVTSPNSDLHAVHASPSHVRELTKADLVVAIHPQLETWVADLEKAGSLRRPVLYLARDILGESLGHQHGEHCDHGHHHGDVDPHVWMNPDLTARMAKTLAKRLAEIDPEHAERHRAGGDAYAAKMKTLAAEIEKMLAAIPAERRVVLSQHGNLGRFAERFQLRDAGSLLDGSSTETADPSARRIAGLIARVRKEKIPAIFADNTLSPTLPAAVAKEAGLPAPTTLYVDALDKPGTPAGNYEGLMRENARRIAEALK